MKAHGSIEELLAAGAVHHVSVLSYQISMGRPMWLKLHQGGFVYGTELRAMGCRSWHGPFDGGPWNLALEPIPESAGGGLRFFDRGGALELICDEIVIAKSPRFQIPDRA